MTEDTGRGEDTASVLAKTPPVKERGTWHTIYRIDKYEDGREPDGHPDDVFIGEGNLLCNAGIQEMLDLLARNLGTTYSSGGNAYLAAGSDNGAILPLAAANTTLGAEYTRKSATATVTNQSVAFQATFTAGQAIGAWEEVGTLNAAAAGSLLNRIVSSLGTKGAGSVWVLTVTITIS